MGGGHWIGVPFVALATVCLFHACALEGAGTADGAPALRAARSTPETEGLVSIHVPLAVAFPLPYPFAAADAAAPPPDTDASTTACPDDMILVEGMYCPQPKQVCKRWMDPLTSVYAFFRCAEYEQPSVCLSPQRERKRFCIDREEYVRPGDGLPLANQSWRSASKICASLGRRLCKESEWQFACEGEEMRPYPYGFVRDSGICNVDQSKLGKPQEGLRDLRAPTSAYPLCLSPFGVHDMSGNVEEWATLDHGAPPDRSTMKGAWWLPGKNNCRAATLGHGETYEGPQVGVRCCAEVIP